jgi:hypothetical protein
LRKVAGTDATAAEGEGIGHQHHIAAAGQFVGPCDAAVIALPMGDHERVRVFGGAGDLARAEVFVAAVVVKGEDGGQSASGARGFEEERLGGRTVRQLPGEVLDSQAVEIDVMLDGCIRRAAGFGLQQRIAIAGAGLGAPCAESGPCGLSEGEAR